MYCSHCGSISADNQTFCKNCGARNGPEHVHAADRIRGLAIAAAGGIGVFGLVGFFFVMRELLRSPASTPGNTVFILVAYLVALLAMFTIFIRIGKGEQRSTRANDVHRTSPPQPTYLRPATTAQLDEPHEMPASVTEHTTRTLEEIPLNKR